MQVTKEQKPINIRVVVYIVLIFAFAQIAIGAYSIYTRNQFISYQQCKNNYDQQFATASAALTEASRTAADANFEWVQTIPGILKPNPSEKQINRFRVKLEDYLVKYRKLQRERVTNAYPQPPEQFCGEPPKG